MRQLTILLLMLTPSLATALEGKVISISDGDTLTLLTNNKKQVKIRLAEIDTPEKAQPYGQKAKQALSSMVFQKTVKADVQTKDKYGRSIAHIYLGNTWVNAELVKQGAAWVYDHYSDSKKLKLYESEAKTNKRGIWTLPLTQQVPPWEWRRNKRTITQSKAKPDYKHGFSCGNKKYCKHMTSCEEAKFYLNQCNLTGLDRDKDGIPCEKLCRSN
ncbi:thermonuclease family protein [Spartinivicinus poritis]|uniref:Thermonuclease family protein n=1 Tax=Spartinivicinus poritis TaxID=2994640 RepID=A0ABT5UHS6_9GAMM|nr:thermonuclease family protein [Spartinivicinus sp. A2-2]MDE1465939.1 thermonuclease family protein [Spartinivicinus sp. A2-2]